MLFSRLFWFISAYIILMKTDDICKKNDNAMQSLFSVVKVIMVTLFGCGVIYIQLLFCFGLCKGLSPRKYKRRRPQIIVTLPPPLSNRCNYFQWRILLKSFAFFLFIWLQFMTFLSKTYILKFKEKEMKLVPSNNEFHEFLWL